MLQKMVWLTACVALTAAAGKDFIDTQSQGAIPSHPHPKQSRICAGTLANA